MILLSFAPAPQWPNESRSGHYIVSTTTNSYPQFHQKSWAALFVGIASGTISKVKEALTSTNSTVERANRSHVWLVFNYPSIDLMCLLIMGKMMKIMMPRWRGMIRWQTIIHRMRTPLFLALSTSPVAGSTRCHNSNIIKTNRSTTMTQQQQTEYLQLLLTTGTVANNNKKHIRNSRTGANNNKIRHNSRQRYA
jgi:hypothetical protein